MSHPYDDLFCAVGRVVYEWSWLENDVAALVFDLSAIDMPSFYSSFEGDALVNALSANLDLKANIAIIKTLAFAIDDQSDFYTRVERVTNFIGNELRNTRNRYVHDRWHINTGKVIRYKSGTVIKREPSSGKRLISYGSTEEYASVSEVDAFAEKIHLARRDIMRLSEEAQSLFRQKHPYA